MAVRAAAWRWEECEYGKQINFTLLISCSQRKKIIVCAQYSLDRHAKKMSFSKWCLLVSDYSLKMFWREIVKHIFTKLYWLILQSCLL